MSENHYIPEKTRVHDEIEDHLFQINQLISSSHKNDNSTEYVMLLQVKSIALLALATSL